MEIEKQGKFISTCLTVCVCVFPSAFSSVHTCRNLEIDQPTPLHT